MKKHRNTLYITSPDAFIRKEGETFVVELDNKKAFQAPVHTIENIVCFGYKPVTPALMAYCSENNIGISYLSPNGKFLAHVRGAQSGNVTLRKSQYNMSDSQMSSKIIARNIVAAKISSSRKILQRHIRNHGKDGNEKVNIAIKKLAHNLDLLAKHETLDGIRGVEGDSASIYFSCFDNMITNKNDEFRFEKRTRRPPLNAVNALLSFIYMIIVNDIRSAIEVTGLDPQVGFLHRIRSGRPSLALDIMEEFRAYIGDRIVLNMVNLNIITINDFTVTETGEYRISDNGRKELLMAYQKRKDEVIEHPLLGEKTTIGLLYHIQAMLCARFVRGDIDEYPPFVVR
jgi:CRISP-associated protein Cas1